MPKKQVQPQDKYVLRLPDGLRDRIKAYAERHGRSMNTEIVRILEREFPEPRNLERRVYELLDLVGVLTAGADHERVGKLVDGLEETIRLMANGQVKGIDSKLQEQLLWRLEHLDEERLKDAATEEAELDDEEIEERWRTGKTTKHAEPND